MNAFKPKFISTSPLFIMPVTLFDTRGFVSLCAIHSELVVKIGHLKGTQNAREIPKNCLQNAFEMHANDIEKICSRPKNVHFRSPVERHKIDFSGHSNASRLVIF